MRKIQTSLRSQLALFAVALFPLKEIDTAMLILRLASDGDIQACGMSSDESRELLNKLHPILDAALKRPNAKKAKRVDVANMTHNDEIAYAQRRTKAFCKSRLFKKLKRERPQ